MNNKHISSNEQENVIDENEELSFVDSYEKRDEISNIPAKTPQPQ